MAHGERLARGKRARRPVPHVAEFAHRAHDALANPAAHFPRMVEDTRHRGGRNACSLSHIAESRHHGTIVTAISRRYRSWREPGTSPSRPRCSPGRTMRSPVRWFAAGSTERIASMKEPSSGVRGAPNSLAGGPFSQTRP